MAFYTLAKPCRRCGEVPLCPVCSQPRVFSTGKGRVLKTCGTDRCVKRLIADSATRSGYRRWSLWGRR